MTRLRVYIAGPMTGIVDFNYPNFFGAALSLLDAGLEPINPARTQGRETCQTWTDYMRASLRDIADADAMLLLPGRHQSLGARLETKIAAALRIPAAESIPELLGSHFPGYQPTPHPDVEARRAVVNDDLVASLNRLRRSGQ